MLGIDRLRSILGNENSRREGIAKKVGRYSWLYGAMGEPGAYQKRTDRKLAVCSAAILCVCLAVFAASVSSSKNSGRKISLLERSDNAEDICVNITLKRGDEVYSEDLYVSVLPRGGAETDEQENPLPEEHDLSDLAEDIASRLGEDREGDALILPDSEGDVTLSWRTPKEEPVPAVAALGLFAVLVLYFSRFDGLEKRYRAGADEFEAELPNAALQLALLLNAGLVTDSAFERLIYQNEGSDSVFYKVLRELLERSEEVNSPFLNEMFDCARETESRSFIRFAMLCSEQRSRGSELVEKLESERELLWNDRLGRARARSKEAETKLCFPLMLLLVSLVVICIAPAFLSM